MYVAPAPVEKFIAPAPAVYAAPAPVVELLPVPAVVQAPTPVEENIAPAPGVLAPTLVKGNIAPAPAVLLAPAPVVKSFSPVPAVSRSPAPGQSSTSRRGDEEVEDDGMDEIYAESRFPAGFLPKRMCRWFPSGNCRPGWGVCSFTR